MKWLIPYSIIAILLSAAVWFGVPMVKEQLTPRPKSNLTLQAEDTNLPPQKVVTPPPERKQPPAPKPPVAVKPKPVTKPVATKPKTPAQPQYERPHVASPEEGASWVITKEKVGYYRPGGARIGELPPGVVLDCLEYREVRGKQAMLCAVRGESQEQKYRCKQCLVALKSLVMMTSTPDALSTEELEALSRYYALKSKLQHRHNALYREQNPPNPYHNDYKEASNRYKALKQEQAELLDKRNNTSGAEKIEAENRLHELKFEQEAATTKLLAQQERFRKWEKEHPKRPVITGNDPQYKQLKEKLRAVEPLVEGLVEKGKE